MEWETEPRASSFVQKNVLWFTVLATQPCPHSIKWNKWLIIALVLLLFLFYFLKERMVSSSAQVALGSLQVILGQLRWWIGSMLRPKGIKLLRSGSAEGHQCNSDVAWACSGLSSMVLWGLFQGQESRSRPGTCKAWTVALGVISLLLIIASFIFPIPLKRVYGTDPLCLIWHFLNARLKVSIKWRLWTQISAPVEHWVHPKKPGEEPAVHR